MENVLVYPLTGSAKVRNILSPVVLVLKGDLVIFLCVSDEGILVDGGSLGSFFVFVQKNCLFNISA